MAGEFLVIRREGTLVVHALPEPENKQAIILPVPILSLTDKTYAKPPIPAVATGSGPAYLLDNINKPEETLGVFMNTRVAAGAVIDFFVGRPDIFFDVNDQHAHHIPDEFLIGMPPELAATVLRARQPELHTGVYL